MITRDLFALLKKQIILFILFYTSISYSANVREFETTRMMATAGTGVGSLLHVESSFLNPAPLVFFNTSSLYYQRSSAEITGAANNSPELDSPKSDAIVAADASGALKGAVSYTNQREFQSQRKRYGLNFGSLMSDSSALGIGYRYTVEEEFEQEQIKYHQITIGTTHIINESLSLGAVLIDPFKSNGAQYTRFMFGAQYTITDKFLIMGDVGANYEKSLSENTIWRFAGQFNFFSYIYVRAGVFTDKVTSSKGNGWGISWIGPKLGIDFAMKESKGISEENILAPDQRIKEMAISVSLRF